MKKSFKLLATFTVMLTMLSFRDVDTQVYVGTYGVSDADPSQIKLTINADGTFYYQDFSSPAKKIVATGNWAQKGKKVILNASNPVGKFHNVWAFESNGQVAKSHKGLTFYRLTKLAG